MCTQDNNDGFEKLDNVDMDDISSFDDQAIGFQKYEEEEKVPLRASYNDDNDEDFQAIMRAIDDSQNTSGFQTEQQLPSSFLKMSKHQFRQLNLPTDPNQSFCLSYKEQQKLEKQQEKQMRKEQRQEDKQFKKELKQQKKIEKQLQRDNGFTIEVKSGKTQQSGKKNKTDKGYKTVLMTDDSGNSQLRKQIPHFDSDVKFLMKHFTLGRDIIEEIFLQVQGDRDLAFEKLEEIEEIIVSQNYEDLATQYNGSDDEDDEMMAEDHEEFKQTYKDKQRQLERDRKMAQDLQRKEKLQNEQDLEQQLMKELNMSEEQLSDLRMLEMLQEFLFKYRFQEKAEKLSNKRDVKAKDMQLKKPKTLSINEQDVFRQFLLWLQTQQFNILEKNAQIKSQLKDNHGYSEEQLNSNNSSANSNNTPGNPQKPQSTSSRQVSNVNIDNKKDFPDLISEQEVQRHLKQQQINHRMNLHNQRDMQSKRKFQASNALQEQKLYEIQDLFKALDHDLIQEAYYTLNDSELLKKLLKIAFPGLMTRNDYDNNQQVYDQIFRYQKQKEQAESRIKRQVIDQVQYGDDFFTEDILRRFKFMNKQRSRPQADQDVYEQSRLESQKIYAQRKQYLDEFKKAKKLGNQQQADYAEKKAEEFRKLYEQSLQNAQMQIFSMKNSQDSMDYYIDLHGIHLQEAITILNRRLNQIQVDLDNGTLAPNINDGRNHVLKIVCGKGIHSKGGRPVLKHKIPKFLDEKGYQYYNFENDGVVLVRLQPRK